MNSTELSWLELDGHPPIACRIRPGGSPGMLFLSGYASDMEGSKALALDSFAAQHGLAMARFDYSGTGSSKGGFEAVTLEQWLDEALAVVDRLTEGPLIVVGSSMGGWIALHLALRRPERVQALVGVAAAPDFTDWGFTAEQKKVIESEGRLVTPNPYSDSPYVVPRTFWQSAQQLRLLEAPIGIHCPVRLIHGELDKEVPVVIAMRLVRQLRSADVQLNILKGGGHRLSEPHEIATILRTVQLLLEPA